MIGHYFNMNNANKFLAGLNSIGRIRTASTRTTTTTITRHERRLKELRRDKLES